MAPLVWLITGCSSGFGEQLVHSVLARGDKVIATGRLAAERLKHLEPSGAAIVDLDVSKPETEIKQTIDKAVEIYGTIDVLVNNAGISSFAIFEELSIDQYRKVFDVNYFGTIAVTKAVAPHMRARQSGTVAFVGSMFGWWAPGGVAAYAGSKFALEAFAYSIQAELAPFNIRTTIFNPGFFQTEFSKPHHLITGDPANMLEAYAPLREAMISMGQSMIGHERGDVKKAAKIIIDVVRGEGCAAGRKFPFRLPIGEDAVTSIEAKCKQMLELIEKWRADVVKTDRDDRQEQLGVDAVTMLPPMES